MSHLRECEFDRRILTTPDVIRASHVVVKANSFPTRIVIREQGSGERTEYVVHMEILKMDASPERDHLTIALKHEGFMQGSYCSSAERAIEVYHERVRAL